MRLSKEYYKSNLGNIIFRVINTIIVIAVIGTILFWVAKAKFNTIEITIPHDILNQTTLSSIDNNTGTYSVGVNEDGDTTLRFDYVAYYKYKSDIRKTIDKYIKETLKDEDIQKYINNIEIANDYTQANIYLKDIDQDIFSTLTYAGLSIALSYELQFYDLIRMKDNSIEIRLIDFNNNVIEVITESNIQQLLDSLASNESNNSSKNKEGITHDSIDKKIKLGKKAKLSTIKVKIDDIQITNTLKHKDYENKTAQDGTKFIVVTLDVENITKSTIETSLGDMLLIDNKDRTFTSDSDSSIFYSEYEYYMTLQPNIEQKTTIIYNVPDDTECYALLTRHADTDKIYGLLLE